MRRRLNYAHVPNGKGFMHPYGRVLSGQTLDCLRHDAWYDTEENAVLVHWEKKTSQPFFVSKDIFDSWRYEDEEVEAAIAADLLAENRAKYLESDKNPTESEPKKRGRPKGSKNKSK